MTNAIFPGTFDPITKGHLDIVERGSAIFDYVTVGVYEDSDKNTLFNIEERICLIREAVLTSEKLKKYSDFIKVKSFYNLLIEFAKIRSFVDVFIDSMISRVYLSQFVWFSTSH